MESLRKKETGLVPLLASVDWRDERSLKNMSISELVSELRDTFLMDDFDRVEEALVARDARLKAEIGSLQEKVEVERMRGISVEEELKKCKEESWKGNAQSSGGKSFNAAKIIKENLELRNKNRELESENQKLELFQKKWVDDRNVIAKLRTRNRELEEEKKNWLNDRDAIAELRIENRRLEDEKRKADSLVESWKKKVQEVNERLLRLKNETNTKLLKNEDTPYGENTERDSRGDASGIPNEVKEEKEMVEMDVRGCEFGSNTEGPAFSLCAGTRKPPSIPVKDGLGASARGRLGLKTVIEVEDSDKDECNSRGTLHEKEAASVFTADNGHPGSSGAVQQRNLPTGLTGTNIDILDGLDTDTDASSSSSSSDSFDLELLPSNIFASLKKRKTEAASLGLNSLPREEIKKKISPELYEQDPRKKGPVAIL